MLLMLVPLLMATRTTLTAPLVEISHSEYEGFSSSYSSYSLSKLNTRQNHYKLPPGFRPSLILDGQFSSLPMTVLAEKGTDGSITRIWADWNCNRKVEPYELSLAPESYSERSDYNRLFRFTSKNRTAYGPVQVGFLVNRANQLSVLPLKFYGATYRVARKKVEIRTSDTNADGRLFGDLIYADQMRIWITGLAGSSGSGDYSNSWIWLPDHWCYLPELSANGKALLLKPNLAPMGSVTFGSHSAETVSVTLKGRRLEARSVSGGWELPAGAYTDGYVQFKTEAPNGEIFDYSIEINPRGRLVVKPGKPTIVQVGGGISGQIKQTKRGSVVNLELICRTKQGFKLYSVRKTSISGQSVQTALPTLIITNSQGKVVHRGSFDFG